MQTAELISTNAFAFYNGSIKFCNPTVKKKKKKRHYDITAVAP